MTIHKVKPGDTPLGIARIYGIPLRRLLEDNGLDEESRLVPGQQLVILTPEQNVRVKEGDTLYSISQRTGIPVNALLRNNPILRGVPLIYPGQTLTLTLEGNARGREIVVNGYVYPFIEEEVLRRVLPYLTYMTVFTYGFRADGSLIEASDERILEIAKGYDVGAILLISTLDEDGSFNNELPNRLFDDPEAEDRLIDALIAVAEEKGYRGVEVDFEYLYAEDAARYAAFLGKLKRALTAAGFLLFVALAPKVAADQPGLLYEGHDYRAIGAVADYVILMTYEWGYRFGPPGAVAPIPNVERVIRYAVSEIPPEKILVGVPNYGYDWPLPFVAGETEAKSLSNVEAVAEADRRGAPIQYDTTDGAPYFNYYEDGVQHVVWFENAESVADKLALTEEYGLAGISIWNTLRWFPQLYAVLNGEHGIR